MVTISMIDKCNKSILDVGIITVGPLCIRCNYVCREKLKNSPLGQPFEPRLISFTICLTKLMVIGKEENIYLYKSLSSIWLFGLLCFTIELVAVCQRIQR